MLRSISETCSKYHSQLLIVESRQEARYPHDEAQSDKPPGQ